MEISCQIVARYNCSIFDYSHNIHRYKWNWLGGLSIVCKTLDSLHIKCRLGFNVQYL